MLKGPPWRPNSQVSGLSVLLNGLEVSDGGPSRANSRGRSLVIAYAPKKSSKKKPQQSSQSQDTTDGAGSPPLRIIDTSQLSLKRQKRFVDARKKAEQATSSKQVVPKKFRRKPLDPDERYAQERARMEAAQAQRAAQDVMRRQRRAVRDMLRAREEDPHLPVLLVDGYNVLHRKWQLRQDAESCPLNLEDEREALINDTRDYALSLSCRPIVVFDAMANRNPLITPRELTAGVEVVYTKDSDADLFIMAEAKAQRQAGAPRVVVVTGDSEISASLEYGSAMGWMTSEMYMLEMKRVTHLANKAQRAAEEQQYEELLEGGGNIALSALKDKETLEKVAELRRKLGNGRGGQGKSLFRMERW